MTPATSFLDAPADAARIAAALRLVIADFDGRTTSTVTGKGGKRYEFFPTAVTDNIPPLTHELAQAICLLARLHIARAAEATLGVGEEDRGAMITADLLGQYRLPRTLARWTPSGAPGEISVGLSNEYIDTGTTRIYLNGVRPGDKILLVDDLISTGGTLEALIAAIRVAGAEVVEIFTVGEKTENGGRAYLRERCGVSIKTLIGTTITDTPAGPRSRVTHANLGHIVPAVFDTVASQFPAGLCRMGSGE